MSRKGIDVAKYQKLILWPQVLASGIEVACAKVCNGTYESLIDPMFIPNRNGMRIFRNRLFYQWLRPEQSPEDQADFYYAQIGEFALGETWMLDFEQAGTTANMARRWVARIREISNRQKGFTYTGMVNTGAGFMGYVSWRDPELWDAHNGRFPAAYTNEAHMRSLAAPYSDDVKAWQNTNKLIVPGVPTPVDGDIFFDENFLDAACGYSAIPPIVNGPTTPAEIEDIVYTIISAPNRGSALCQLVVQNDGVPRFKVKGFDVAGAQTGPVWGANPGVGKLPLSDAQFDDIVAAGA